MNEWKELIQYQRDNPGNHFLTRKDGSIFFGDIQLSVSHPKLAVFVDAMNYLEYGQVLYEDLRTKCCVEKCEKEATHTVQTKDDPYTEWPVCDEHDDLKDSLSDSTEAKS